MESVKLINVTKDLKGETILNNVNLTISEGEIVGLQGRNGSGKSVLLKIISGLMSPTEGNVYISGNTTKKGNFPDEIGLSLDCTGFLPTLTAFDNLKTIAEIRNIIKDDDIKKYIEMVGLNPKSTKKVGEFSLGMKQRLSIAQAIMESPKLLLLDEPFNGLDEKGVILLKNLIKDLNNKGCTIILTSHNKEDLNELCTVIYKISGNKLVLSQNDNLII